MSENEVVFNTQEIREILLHRYPFLLVDKVVEFVDNEKIVGIKNVTVNEPFFQGHFPNYAVMPGVLILEAMAQTAAILAIKSTDGAKPGNTIFLVGADDFRWKRQVVPGDTLRIEMRGHKKRLPFWIMKGEAYVEGELAASGTISAMEAE